MRLNAKVVKLRSVEKHCEKRRAPPPIPKEMEGFERGTTAECMLNPNSLQSFRVLLAQCRSSKHFSFAYSINVYSASTLLQALCQARGLQV